MTNLRDHITAAIAGVDDWRGVTDPAILADAVMELIAELELREETRDGFAVKNGLKDIIRYKKPQHRYVTEWTTDE